MGLNFSRWSPYISGMVKSRVPTPQQTLNFKPLKLGGRTYKVGDEIMIPARIIRTGRNGFDTVDTLTARIGGIDVPVTAPARYLLGQDDDA